MFVAVIILHVIASIALILIVLLQAGKGAGISNVFGGAGQTVFGARTGDMLARGTEFCAALFMLTSLGLAMMSSDRSSSVMRRRPMQMPGSQGAVPFSPSQQAAMNKMKEAFAGITNTVKQAATTASTQQNTTAPQTASAPVAAAPAAEAPKSASSAAASEPAKTPASPSAPAHE